MNTTLENLTEKVRENRLMNLAKNVIQYQNFKTSTIIKKVDSAGLTLSTLKGYIDNGISYIKTGKINSGVKGFVKYIDANLKNCVQPLTPKKEDERCFKKSPNKSIHKKEAALPVQNVLKEITAKNIKKAIAVKMNNNIVIQSSEEEANGFIKGIEFMDKNLECKLINISYEAI